MFTEDDLLPLSALSQLVYCERRAALVHIEGLWGENAFTLEGSHLHGKVDEVSGESRPGVRIARAVPLHSLRLGLSGKADVIEFRIGEGGGPETPYPVDYKRGRLPKWEQPCWEIQLCGQAICLEEMLAVPVPEGAIYFGKSRRRLDVSFTPELRARTEEAAARLHELVASCRTPRAVPGPRCEKCSLADVCIPKASSGRRSAAAYLRDTLRAESSGGQPPRDVPKEGGP